MRALSLAEAKLGNHAAGGRAPGWRHRAAARARVSGLNLAPPTRPAPESPSGPATTPPSKSSTPHAQEYARRGSPLGARYERLMTRPAHVSRICPTREFASSALPGGRRPRVRSAVVTEPCAAQRAEKTGRARARALCESAKRSPGTVLVGSRAGARCVAPRFRADEHYGTSVDDYLQGPLDLRSATSFSEVGPDGGLRGRRFKAGFFRFS